MTFDADAYSKKYQTQLAEAGDLSRQIAEAESAGAAAYNVRTRKLDIAAFNAAFAARRAAIDALVAITLNGVHDEQAVAFMISRLVDTVASTVVADTRMQYLNAPSYP